MYKAFIDGAVFHDPTLDDPAALIIDAEVTKQANAADSFTFTVYPDNPRYSEIYKLTSVVEVEKDGKTIFRGRPIKSADGWENQQTITCEGELAFLNDSVLRPYEYKGTVRGYLQSIITAHNSTMPPEKQFTLRTVTVTDPNDNIVRSNGNYTVTMQEIQEKLVNSLGGYLYIERTGGVLYLDYLADSTKATGQTITISKNLIDFAREQNAENIATGIVPLGATDETTGLPITIAPVNDGRDYITDPEAVARYGTIFVTETWDDVTVPANLLTKARARLTQYTKLVANITLTAVDLSVTDQEIDPIECLDYVTVQDDAHEASGLYLVTARTYNLNDPSKDTVTFGGEQESIARSTSRTAYETSEMPARILKNASARAREILDSSTDGNIYFRFNDQGKIYEIDFLNAETPETATQMWRWNLGGWGFYDKTTDTYTTAATMDGSFLANIITAGILQSDDGTTFYLDLDNGVLRGNFSELKIAGAAGATQSYADGKASAAKAGAEATAANALSAFNTSLNQQEVFNRLTNNQANQGIYLENGQLYINASMIRAGMLISLAINNGNGTFAVDENGNVTATSGKIGNWSIGTNGLSNEFWNDDTIPYSGAAYYLQNLNQILLGTQFPSASEFFDYDANGDGKLNSTDLAIFTNMGQNSRNLNRYHDFTIELNSQTGRIALTEEYRARLGTTGTTFTGTRSTVIMPGAIQTGAYCGTDGYFSNQVSADKVIYSTLQQASDRSIKDKIRSIGKRFLNALKELNPVSFVYKHDKTQKERYGLIAQEVEKTDLSGLIGESGDMKSLNYMDLIAVLISGWQDHENRIKKLEERES